MPQFNSDSPLKSEVSYLNNLRFLNFRAPGPKFVLAQEPRVLVKKFYKIIVNKITLVLNIFLDQNNVGPQIFVSGLQL